ncbi:hypothetical protein D3C87_1165960 [compost metagenome]
MTNCNCATVNVDFFCRDFKFLHRNLCHHSKSFVDFPKINVADFQVCFGKCLFNRANRSCSEIFWFVRESSVRNDFSQRFNATFFSFAFRHQNVRRSSVVDFRSVRRCDCSGFIKSRFQSWDFIEVRVERLFVFFNNNSAFFAFNRNRYDFIFESAIVPCFLRFFVRINSESILLFTCEVMFLYANFSSISHVEIVVWVPQAVFDHRVCHLCRAHTIARA